MRTYFSNCLVCLSVAKLFKKKNNKQTIQPKSREVQVDRIGSTNDHDEYSNYKAILIERKSNNTFLDLRIRSEH